MPIEFCPELAFFCPIFLHPKIFDHPLGVPRGSGREENGKRCVRRQDGPPPIVLGVGGQHILKPTA